MLYGLVAALGIVVVLVAVAVFVAALVRDAPPSTAPMSGQWFADRLRNRRDDGGEE